MNRLISSQDHPLLEHTIISEDERMNRFILDIRGNQFNRLSLRRALSPAECPQIIQALKENTSFVDVSLWINSILPRDIVSIFICHPSLQVLDLNWYGIDDRGLHDLIPLFHINTRIKELHLGENNIGNRGARDIAQILLTTQTLTSLNLYANDIGNEGALALSQALIFNTSLRKLDLNENSIGQEGGFYFIQSLAMNNTLLELDIDFNPLTIDDNIFDEINREIRINHHPGTPEYNEKGKVRIRYRTFNL